MTTPRVTEVKKPAKELAYGEGAYDDFGLALGSLSVAAQYDNVLSQTSESGHKAEVIDIASATGNLAVKQLAVAA